MGKNASENARIAFFFLLGLFAYLCLRFGPLKEYGLVPGDFHPFVVVGKRVLTGESIYQAEDISPFKYSPAFALAMSVFLAHISKDLGWWLWCLLSTALFAWVTYQFSSLAGFFELKRGKMLAAAAVALLAAWHGIIEHQSYGQADMLMLGFFGLSVLSGEKGKNLQSGFWLACCWLSKPPTLILGAHFLLRRRHKPIAHAAMVAAALLALPALYWGPSRYAGLFRDWLHVMRTRQPVEFLTGNLNQGLAASLARWLGMRHAMPAFAALIALLSGALTLWLWKRRKRPESAALAAVYAYLLYMLATPLSWRWMTCAWLACGLVVFSEAHRRRKNRAAFLRVLAIAFTALALFLQSLIAKRFGVSEPDQLSAWGLYTLGTLMLFGGAVSLLRGESERGV